MEGVLRAGALARRLARAFAAFTARLPGAGIGAIGRPALDWSKAAMLAVARGLARRRAAAGAGADELQLLREELLLRMPALHPDDRAPFAEVVADVCAVGPAAEAEPAPAPPAGGGGAAPRPAAVAGGGAPVSGGRLGRLLRALGAPRLPRLAPLIGAGAGAGAGADGTFAGLEDKARELFEAADTRRGALVLGPPLSGKSACIAALQRMLEGAAAVGAAAAAPLVELCTVYPKALSSAELFGHDPANGSSGDWVDGLVPALFCAAARREAAGDGRLALALTVLDGPLDPGWVDPLCGCLDQDEARPALRLPQQAPPPSLPY